jgi:hypothetical protein
MRLTFYEEKSLTNTYSTSNLLALLVVQLAFFFLLTLTLYILPFIDKNQIEIARIFCHCCPKHFRLWKWGKKKKGMELFLQSVWLAPTKCRRVHNYSITF